MKTVNIENIDEVTALLIDMSELLNNLDDVKKNIESQIKIKELEQKDYLHELEIAKLNGIEIMSVSKALIKTRRERRILKDKLELTNTLKGYTDTCIKKGIIGETKQVITNIENLKKYHETREYVPRVIKDLKCAKKRKE